MDFSKLIMTWLGSRRLISIHFRIFTMSKVRFPFSVNATSSSSGFLTEFSRVTQNLKKNMVFFKAGWVVVTKKQPNLWCTHLRQAKSKLFLLKSYSLLFLGNRIENLGWLGQLRILEFINFLCFLQLWAAFSLYS